MKYCLAALAVSAALIAVSGSGLVWCADVATDAEHVKQQAVANPDLQQAAADVGGYKLSDIDVKSEAHQITVVIINSKLNGGEAEAREAEASKIVTAIEKAIAVKDEFASVMMIHVDFVERQGSHSSTVQVFDFTKTPAGGFVAHHT